MACRVITSTFRSIRQILFICTANTLNTILPPLLDRCKFIQLSGYTHDEKLHFPLLPKQLTQNERTTTNQGLGLPLSSLLPPLPGPSEDSNALVKRSKDGDACYDYIVEADELEKIPGLSRKDSENREREARQGVV
jgi:ATP-dependent Lon protease